VQRLLHILLVFAFHAPLAVAAELVPPVWQALVLEKQSLWGSARAELALQREGNCSAAGWRMMVVNSLPGSRESIDLTLSCVTGQISQRSRLSSGRDQRLKSYLYTAEAVERLRREPPPDSVDDAGDAQRWPISSRQVLSLPEPVRAGILIAPHSLLLLLDTILEGPREQVLYALSDLNFYRLDIAISDADTKLDEPLQWEGKTLAGVRIVRRITVTPTPLPGNPEDPDFSFFGLSGRLTIDVDAATHLPLRVRGAAPRLGSTELSLVGASPATERGAGDVPASKFPSPGD
jgi:hypothetical protein